MSSLTKRAPAPPALPVAEAAAPASPVDEDPDLDFDEPLGSFNGVVAYSNLDDHFFSGEKHFMHGIYTGYKYQCVEFARRYLLLSKGCVFGNCFRAAEIFGMKVVTNVVTEQEYELTAYPNGKTTELPQPGDILVYNWDPKLMPVGHVAIIAARAEDNSWVGIAEQNQESKSWKGQPYGRRVPLVQDKETGFWTMQETDPEITNCAGWMRTLAPDRVDPKTGHVLIHLHEAKDRFREIAKPIAAELLPAPSATKPTIPKDLPADAAQCVEQYQSWLARAGRPVEWQSLISPNEDLGVGTLGACFRLFRTLATGINAVVGGLADDAISSTFGIPSAFVPLVRQQLKSVAAHGTGGSLVGHLDITYSTETKSFMVTQVDLDNLQSVIDVTALQTQFALDHNMMTGFLPSRITADVSRILKTLAQASVKVGASNRVLFVDFGPRSFASEAVNADYEINRQNILYLGHFLKKAVADINQAHEADPSSDAAPFDIDVVSVANLLVNVDGSVTTIDSSDHKPVALVFKAAKWEHLFALAASDIVVEQFVNVAGRADDASIHGAHGRRQPLVVQPVWTALASHPALLPLVAQWAAASDAAFVAAQAEDAPDAGDDGLVAPFFPPAASFTGTKSSARLFPASSKGTAAAPSTTTHIATRAIIVGAKWSAGHFLESAEGLVSSSKRPAGLLYRMGGSSSKEDDDEKKEE